MGYRGGIDKFGIKNSPNRLRENFPLLTKLLSIIPHSLSKLRSPMVKMNGTLIIRENSIKKLNSLNSLKVIFLWLL